MIASLVCALQSATPALDWVQTLEPPGRTAVSAAFQRIPHGPVELLTIAADGRVRSFAAPAEAGLPFDPEGRGSLTLTAPTRTLVQLVRTQGPEAPLELLTLSPRGCESHAVGEDGAVAASSRRLARRARFDLRLGAPQQAPFASDVDGDGRIDLMVPELGAVALWELAPADSDVEPAPRSRLRLRVDAPAAVYRAVEQGDLTDVLVSRISLPGLVTEDINGDGLPDLVVSEGSTRAFHLARPDTGLPASADVTLDLELFRDPSAAGGGFEPGQILSLGGEAELRQRDVDGDGVEDYLIVAGRKVWVFPSTSEGPQFTEPSTILKSAEAVTVAILVPVDDDELAELTLLRLKLPTVTTLVLGLVSSFDVELRASAYRNLGGGKFAQTPDWNGGVKLRVPPILDLIRDPFALVERFRDAGKSFRAVLSGDFDGDGVLDAAIEDEARTGLEVWLGADAGRAEITRGEIDTTLREVLFDDDDRVWDLDRILDFVGQRGGARAGRVTGGAERAGFLAYPEGSQRVGELLACDPEGDGRHAIVVGFRTETGATLMRVAELSP